MTELKKRPKTEESKLEAQEKPSVGALSLPAQLVCLLVCACACLTVAVT